LHLALCSPPVASVVGSGDVNLRAQTIAANATGLGRYGVRLDTRPHCEGDRDRQQYLAIRKWRLKCKAVADSLEEAGDRLFTFTRLSVSQWKSARTTNAIERLHEEFKRRIKTQTVLPSAETAAMLFWALLAAGQIAMRKVDGWQTLTHKLADEPIDLAA
jgi:transposase-like protein